MVTHEFYDIDWALEDAKSSDSLERRQDLLYLIFNCIRNEQDSYEKQQIERIVSLLWHSPRYSHLIDLLPASWWEYIERITTDLEEADSEISTGMGDD